MPLGFAASHRAPVAVEVTPRANDGTASQQRVLRSLASGEERQRLLGDIGLEVRAVLVRLERGFVAE